jgi:hypothetical protein
MLLLLLLLLLLLKFPEARAVLLVCCEVCK